jgi:hypothetical protein
MRSRRSPRAEEFYRTSAAYGKFLDSDSLELPGYSNYKQAPKSPEDRVLDFFEGTPKFEDVRTAHRVGKLTTEEAEDLRPGDKFPRGSSMYANKGAEATHYRAGLSSE